MPKLEAKNFQSKKVLKCGSCDKSFSRSCTLKRYSLTVHERRKDHKCENCGKSFSEAGDLKKHTYTVHEGHKDFKCESCGKSFYEAYVLKRHINRSHEGGKERSHICAICDTKNQGGYKTETGVSLQQFCLQIQLDSDNLLGP